MTIEEIVKKRKITEVLHFTTNKGLVGILYKRAVQSRKMLPNDKKLEYIFSPNAAFRKDDNWLDYVNLSISRINHQFFKSSQKWHKHKDVWWCMLSFDPEILSHSGVFFATTNNIYTGVHRQKGPNGLVALFENRITRWAGAEITREPNLPTNCPTCYQAEVLYPQELSTKFLRKIYVKEGDHQDEVYAQIGGVAHPNVEVYIKPEIFEESQF